MDKLNNPDDIMGRIVMGVLKLSTVKSVTIFANEQQYSYVITVYFGNLGQYLQYTISRIELESAAFYLPDYVAHYIDNLIRSNLKGDKV